MPFATAPNSVKLYYETVGRGDPLLLVMGQGVDHHGDQITMTVNAILLAERIPQAEINIIRGGRHWFFIEFQAEASEAVLDFLDRHPLSNARYAPS